MLFYHINKRVEYLLLLPVIIASLALSGEAQAYKLVTDPLGRKVMAPDHPKRIVALAPSITEMIFALEQERRLKGATRYSNFPPEAEKLPKVGSYVYLDLERILALKPDLCIAVKDGNPKKVIDKLESLNIPVYAVDPRGLDTVMETILDVGRLLNVPKKGEAIVQEMRSRIQRVKFLAAKAGHRPRVFFQIGITPIVAVGTNTFFHELITLAGGKNLSQGPVPYPRYSKEQIIALSPEVFIISSMARGEAFERVKTEWGRWPSLPAVKNHRIHLVDSDILDRAGPRLADGLELLFRLIHPELAKEIP